MNTVAEGVNWIMANLLYGSGLRLLECLRLSVKDIDFAPYQLLIRAGKGNKDRITLRPAVVEAPLKTHLEEMWQLHQREATITATRTTPYSERRNERRTG